MFNVHVFGCFDGKKKWIFVSVLRHTNLVPCKSTHSNTECTYELYTIKSVISPTTEKGGGEECFGKHGDE